MIQDYLKLFKSVSDYNRSLRSDKGNSTGAIQRIYGTPHLVCLVVRFPGITRYLYFGRGSNYEGFWEGKRMPPASIRVKDRFLEYLRKYLVGSRIGEIILDQNDRVIVLSYYIKGVPNYFSMFYKGRSLYFINFFIDEKSKRRIFLSWELLRNNIVQASTDEPKDDVTVIAEIFQYFDGIGRRKENLGPEPEQREVQADNVDKIEKYFIQKCEGQSRQNFPKRKRKFLQRKRDRIISDLNKVKKWKDLKELIEDSSFEFSEGHVVELCGIKFKLNNKLNIFKKKDLIYQKIKSFRKAEDLLHKRLTECQKELVEWEQGKRTVSSQESKIIQPVWHSSKEKSKYDGKVHSQKEIKEYLLEGKVRLAVGKDVNANDYLRKAWAHKNDYWFHLEGYKSAHCVIKLKDLSDIKSEWFDIIGSILRDNSNLMIEEIPLVYTQVKNLKGIKGKAGSVIYKKEKYLRVKYISNWMEIVSRD